MIYCCGKTETGSSWRSSPPCGKHRARCSQRRRYQGQGKSQGHLRGSCRDQEAAFQREASLHYEALDKELRRRRQRRAHIDHNDRHDFRPSHAFGRPPACPTNQRGAPPDCAHGGGGGGEHAPSQRCHGRRRTSPRPSARPTTPSHRALLCCSRLSPCRHQTTRPSGCSCSSGGRGGTSTRVQEAAHVLRRP